MDYIREAFIYEPFNVRVTFDLNLSSNNSNFDIFSRDLHTTDVILDKKPDFRG